MRFVRPKTSDCAHYYCRKGFYCVNVQAICDAQRRFVWCSILAAGGTHDSTAFALSALSENLGNLGEYYLVGDAAYPCGDNMITPYKGRALSARKDTFNFFQSSARINIECAFGIVIKRFPIFRRPLEMSHFRVAVIVRAAFGLHNFIIDFGNDATFDTAVDEVVLGDEFTDANEDYRLHRSATVGTRRDDIANALYEAGFRRPSRS